MARSRAAAVTEEATPQVPAVRTSNGAVGAPIDYGDFAGAGFESANKDSYAIPFLNVLQSMSPQCKKSDGAYIKGATEGMLLNTVTQQVFDGDEGVEIIPCSFAQTFIEWKTRDNGGGFVAEYDAFAGAALRRNCKRNDKNQDILPNGNQLTDMRNHYVLVKDADDNWAPVLLSLSSTQIKASRNWMSAMQGLCSKQRVPMFALQYKLTTVPQSNDKGSWYGVALEFTSLLDDAETYGSAKAFYEQVKAGAVKTQDRTDATTEGGAGTEDPDDM